MNSIYSEPFYFTKEHIELAQKLKDSGLEWTPQTGCYVTDINDQIKTSSPFDHDIYYVLDLDYFLRTFGSEEKMKASLTWLPTFLEALQICTIRGMTLPQLQENGINLSNVDPGSELLKLYKILVDHLDEDHKRSPLKDRVKNEISQYIFIHYY